MKKLALLLCLSLFVPGCKVEEEKKADIKAQAAKDIPAKTVECYQCDNKECRMNKFSDMLAWYECPKCGAEMTYHKKENASSFEWVLYSFDRGDKLDKEEKER